MALDCLLTPTFGLLVLLLDCATGVTHCAMWPPRRAGLCDLSTLPAGYCGGDMHDTAYRPNQAGLTADLSLALCPPPTTTMVDWHDPVVIARCARLSIFFQDLCGGWYMWEFLISLRFDWEHVTGKHPFRWPQIAYFGARYLLMMSGLMAFRTSLAFGPVNCEAWYHGSYALAHVCVACGSLLLFLRVIAISGRNKLVIAMLCAFYIVQLLALINATVRIRAVYMPELLMCGVANSIVSRLNFFISFGFDFVCLCIVFWYLFAARGAGMWNLLFSQGVIYFIVVISAYMIPAILLILNLNDFMNEMLKVPSVVILIVCTTRMYRDLVVFYSRPPAAPEDLTAASATWNTARTHAQSGGVLVIRTHEVTSSGSRRPDSEIELARKGLDYGDGDGHVHAI
ncbi:hypothetical protein AURDEDRAFT_154717 [Auricularia subglabra TFB-10046 SS5]|uniref:Chitin synthase export chaperone n=1 Tax=Auricularia subglabra (strain TFB-10046 / SS5) TaxID=717982 RepID=J0WSH2_AURST|nr:hypothetical protein AURDEDRAFT_154717 [Auricularia subglabra TFB-10046 SS5]